MATLDRRAGREAFGGDPAGYHGARPAYPDSVWQALAARCGLGPGCATFEVGAGTGTGTAGLLAHGAAPLVAIEPDPRSAGFLRTNLPSPDLSVVVAAFEDAELPAAAFDLGCSFTAFHWVDQGAGLAKARAALKPGGAWAMVWNVFGDSALFDPFHEATKEILSTPQRSPSQEQAGRPAFALDEEPRLADLRAAGFTDLAVERWNWKLVLDPEGVRALYATYSQLVAQGPEALARMLDGVAEVAAREFAGRVERNMVSIVYSGRAP